VLVSISTQQPHQCVSQHRTVSSRSSTPIHNIDSRALSDPSGVGSHTWPTRNTKIAVCCDARPDPTMLTHAYIAPVASISHTPCGQWRFRGLSSTKYNVVCGTLNQSFKSSYIAISTRWWMSPMPTASPAPTSTCSEPIAFFLGQ